MIQIPARFRMTWEQVKPRILPRLLSTEWHAEYIKNLVKIPIVADVVQTFYIDVHDWADCNDIQTHAHIAITYELLQHLGKTIDDLVKASDENSLDAYTATWMVQLLSDFMDAPQPACDAPLLVITSEDGWCASAGILNPNIQQTLKDIVGDDYYVILSSVHEALVAPADAGISVDHMAYMVRSINREVVEPQDCLSDHVFQMKNGQLCAVA